MTMSCQVYKKVYDDPYYGISYFSVNLVTDGSFSVSASYSYRNYTRNPYVQLPCSCIEPVLASSPSLRPLHPILIHNTGEFTTYGLIERLHKPVEFFRYSYDHLRIDYTSPSGSTDSIHMPFTDFVEALDELKYLKDGVEGDEGTQSGTQENTPKAVLYFLAVN